MENVEIAASRAVRAAPRRPRALAWVQLMRLHFAPISLSGALVGMAVGSESPTFASILVGLAACSLGYSCGQVINDYADRKADAINAPDRPFVTGELRPETALKAAGVYALVSIVAAAIVAPAMIVWGLGGVLGVTVYTFTKRIPMVGNTAFGITGAMFVPIGAAAAAPERAWYDVPEAVLVDAALITVALTGMGLSSYFKDIPGDTAVGYRTIVVALGARRARWWLVPFPIVAVGAACALAVVDPGAIGATEANGVFWAAMALASVLFAVSIVQVISDPEGNAYELLLWQTRASVLYALGLAAAAEPALAAAATVPLMLFMEGMLRLTRGTGQA